MRKKIRQKNSPITMISIEPASSESSLGAFLSLFIQEESAQVPVCGKRRLVTGFKSIKIHKPHN